MAVTTNQIEKILVDNRVLRSRANIILAYIDLKHKVDNCSEQSWYFQKALESHQKHLGFLKFIFQKFADSYNEATVDDYLDQISINIERIKELESREFLNWMMRMALNSTKNENVYLKSLIQLKSSLDTIKSLEYYAEKPEEFLQYIG